MAKVELTQGYYTEIDDVDLQQTNQYRWKIFKSRGKLYAARTSGTKTVLLHRQITGAGPHQHVDHKNGNGLDNRRENLRLATQTQNLANMRKTRGKSQFKGVYWNKEKAKWQAQIGAGKYDGGLQRVLYLGRFSSEEDAARAYDAKALELHGKFSLLNFKNNKT